MSGRWTRSALRLARRWGTLAALLACITCDGDTIVHHYDAAHDDAAMAIIASTWTSADGSTISICEDVARSNAWTPGDPCVNEHVVRGGGRGIEHIARHSERGCGGGGCIYGTSVPVNATLVRASSPDPVALSGEVRLNYHGGGDPYAMPYRLYAPCTAAEPHCSFEASVLDADRLEGEFVVGYPGTPQAVTTRVVMTRTGPATCDPAAVTTTDPAPGG